jgi:hypothetical protein
MFVKLFFWRWRYIFIQMQIQCDHLRGTWKWYLVACDAIYCGRSLQTFCRNIIRPSLWSLKVETVHSSETSVNFYQTVDCAWYHIPEDSMLQIVTTMRTWSLTKKQKQKTNELCGLSPQVNYTDRATAACWRS